jgi:hypothetical protein
MSRYRARTECTASAGENDLAPRHRLIESGSILLSRPILCRPPLPTQQFSMQTIIQVPGGLDLGGRRSAQRVCTEHAGSQYGHCLGRRSHDGGHALLVAHGRDGRAVRPPRHPSPGGSSPLSLINSNTWLMCRHVTALIISMAYEAVGEDPPGERRRFRARPRRHHAGCRICSTALRRPPRPRPRDPLGPCADRRLVPGPVGPSDAQRLVRAWPRRNGSGNDRAGHMRALAPGRGHPRRRPRCQLSGERHGCGQHRGRRP